MKRSKTIDSIVGRNIKHWRTIRGMSQTDLGRLVDDPCTFQQIQKYEKGHNRVSTARLVSFAQVLELPVHTLLIGVESLLPIEHEVLHRADGALLKNYQRLDPDLQSAVRGLVQAMATDNLNRMRSVPNAQ